MDAYAEKPTRFLDWFDRTWVNLFKNTATYVLQISEAKSAR